MTSTFCPLPWIHLASMPDGTVPLCCNSNHTKMQDIARNFVDGKRQILRLGQDSIDDIFNSDYFRDVRQTFLKDEVPVACQGCFDLEKQGIKSKRLLSLEEFYLTKDEAVEMTEADGRIDIDFEYLEFRLGNACNLKCVTCNPNSSSLWIKEYRKMEEDLDFVSSYKNLEQKNFQWHESDDFWADLKNYVGKVHYVYINGGEPLINKKHINFLSKLDKNAVIKYNTNSTIINDGIIEMWSKFKKVIVNPSIDDIGDRNDYIRFGSNWDHVQKILEEIKSLDFVEFSITQTISFYNVYYIKEFKNQMKELNLHSHFNFLVMPDFLAAGIATDSMKEAILKKHSDEPYYADLQKYFALFETTSIETKKLLLNKFLNYTKWLDQSRKMDFKKIFPEWYEIIERSLNEI